MAIALLAIALEPFLFVGSFAGDAEIHLVFAESASRGHFFEFNPGERVSGETSPGYMLLGAALFRVVPAGWVPIALKIIGLAGWYLLSWLVYRVAVRVLDEKGDADPVWPAAAAVVAALIPGSVYNANVGMENGLFAAMVWLWIDLAGRWRWFEAEDVGTWSREAALATLLGLSCWLRPEGFVLATLAFAFRLKSAKPSVRRSVMGVAVTAVIGLGCITFQVAYTGDVIATSILSRRVLAMAHGWSIGPLSIDPGFAERLVLYAPLTAFFMVGLRSRLKAHSGQMNFLLLLFGAFFVFYTLAGTPHLARYVIFIAPILAIGAIRGVRAIWNEAWERGRSAIWLAILGLLVIDVSEPLYRRRQFSQHLLSHVMTAPSLRRQSTDDLLHNLGDPTKRPVVMACEAVQQRYDLDARIIVRSLDGRTDRDLFAFVHDGRVDQVGYLKLEKVDFLAGAVSYDRDPSQSALARLDKLSPGATMAQEGLSFRRLPSRIWFAVDPEPASLPPPGL